jgi:hypothetical protein
VITVKCGLVTSTHCAVGDDEKLDETANRRTKDAIGFNIVEAFLPECVYGLADFHACDDLSKRGRYFFSGLRAK